MDLMGRPVRGQNDLLVGFMERVEGVEEFILRTLLAGNKLNIVHEKQVSMAVFIAEFHIFALLQGGDQFVGELVAFDINDLGVGTLAVDLAGDGIEQMGLAETAGAIEKQGIVALMQSVGHRHRGGVGEAVGGAYHKAVKGVFFIEEEGVISAGKVGFFLVAHHFHHHIAVEELLHGIHDIGGKAFCDHIPADVHRGKEDKLGIGDLKDLRIVKKGRYNGQGDVLFEVGKHASPDIGSGVHDRAPFSVFSRNLWIKSESIRSYIIP